jgi:hypothetical protein
VVFIASAEPLPSPFAPGAALVLNHWLNRPMPARLFAEVSAEAEALGDGGDTDFQRVSAW